MRNVGAFRSQGNRQRIDKALKSAPVRPAGFLKYSVANIVWHNDSDGAAHPSVLRMTTAAARAPSARR